VIGAASAGIDSEAALHASADAAILEANDSMRLYHLWRWPFVRQHCRASFQKIEYYTPPFVADAIRRLMSEWEYLPQGWRDVDPAINGWNDQSVAAAQEQHWPTLVGNLQGAGPLGVSHFPWRSTRDDLADHNAMMSFGYVLALAARKKDRLSLLDWGGGVGHYYLYARALVPELELEYHCYDLPHLCALGRTQLPEAQFHDDATGLFERQFDLIVSSSSLQYFEDWRAAALPCRLRHAVSWLVSQPPGTSHVCRGIGTGTGERICLRGKLVCERGPGASDLSRVSPAACRSRASAPAW
jgi:hypothetical protein